jgi:hypothetical protein
LSSALCAPPVATRPSTQHINTLASLTNRPLREPGSSFFNSHPLCVVFMLSLSSRDDCDVQPREDWRVLRPGFAWAGILIPRTQASKPPPFALSQLPSGPSVSQSNPHGPDNRCPAHPVWRSNLPARLQPPAQSSLLSNIVLRQTRRRAG